MTLASRPSAAFAASHRPFFTVSTESSPRPSRFGPHRHNTAAMLARVVIGTLATAMWLGSAHAKEVCVIGTSSGNGFSNSDRLCWDEPDRQADRSPGRSPGYARPLFADPWSGPYETNWHDHHFIPNPGESQIMQNAAMPICGEDSSFPGSGNPIALATGNKIEAEMDFATDGEMGLFLQRTYNHYWNHVGLFGKHWLSNLDYSLTLDVPNDLIYAQRPDGRRIKFVFAGNNRWNEDKAGPVAYILRNPDFTYTHHTESRTVEHYRQDGRVLRVENRQGLGWTFSYVLSYLAIVKHDGGRQIGFGWSDGKLTTVIDPAGKDYTYTYDTHAFGNGVHRLVSATLPGAPATTISYHYEYGGFPGALTGKSYNGTRYSTFGYDADGRAILSEHAGNVDRHTYSYFTHSAAPVSPVALPPPPAPGADCDVETGVCLPVIGMGNPDDPDLIARTDAAATADATLNALAGVINSHIDETSPLGRETHYQFEDYRLTEVEGAATTHCAASYRNRQYDDNGYEQFVEDFNGNRTGYTYNDQGQLLSRVSGFGSPVSQSTAFAWDTPNNRITKITVFGDREESTVYTPDHRLQSVTVKNLSEHGVPNQVRTTTYSYAKHSNGVLSTVTIDGPLAGSGDVITYSYTAKGDLASIKNSLGHIVSYEDHTGLGQPQRITGINGQRTDYLYDDRGRVTRVRTFRNGGQQDIVIAYNAAGLRQSVTTPAGVTESYAYDNARRLVEVSRNEPGGQARQVLTYDAASNVIRTDIYRGNTLRRSAYTDYDELGRVRARRGNHGQHIKYGYDPNDNLTSLTDSLNKVTTFGYDARNRLITQTDPLGGLTRTAYDAGGRVRQVTDPRNLVTAYGYDGFGQLRSQTSPDTGTTTHTWDAGGLLTSTQRADNVTVGYGYDTLGRRTSMSSGGQVHTYGWDSGIGCTGRLCKLTSPGYDEQVSYLPYGEITARYITHMGVGAFDHTFQYDNLGRLTKLTYPNGVEATYGYTLDRTTSVAVKIGNQTRTVATVTSHEPIGPDRQLAFGNGGGRINHYDTDGRLTDIETDLKVGYHFDFDANDRINGFTNFANGFWSQSFSYDELHRLKSSASAGLGNHAYTYDANGNRKSHGTTTYGIANNSNRLMALTGGANRTFTYTPTGNIRTIAGFGGAGEVIYRNGFQIEAPPVTTYSYSPFDRLAGVTAPGVDATYKIGPDGTRFEKTVNGQRTRFAYGPGGMLLTERQDAPARWTNYVWFNGAPIALVRDSALYWIQTDHLGRPEGLTDQTKQRVWRATLKDFSRTVITDHIGGFHLGFPGQYHDTETGHAYNINRNYIPELGRYLESDPIGLSGGINTYVYARSNPVSLTDPLGLVVMVCRDPAFNGSLGPAKHYWLTTDTQSSGMGTPAAGANAGNQYDPLGARVQTISHAERENGGNRECRVAKGADEAKVNRLISPGRDLGIFFPGFNDCQGFVRDVLRQSGGEFPFLPKPMPIPNPYLSDPHK